MNIYKQLTAISVLAMASLSTAAHADEHHHHHAVQAPIGVMGDHNHAKGKWMTSYRYSQMDMEGNRDGTSKVSTKQVLQNFMVAPLDMTMEMHMFGLMYGLTDQFTFMAMVPHVSKTMHHQTRMGMTFKTEARGLGDVKLSGLYTLLDNKQSAISHKVLLNIGASLPTGSIDERGDTPAGKNQKLPYTMQLGSGTIDPLVTVTYVNNRNDWSWGAQANSVIRMGKNNEGYRLGNEYGATSWIAKNIHSTISISGRLEGKMWNDIEGKDGELNPRMVPTARTDLRAGKRVDALLGINFTPSKGMFADSSIAAEYGMPLYQNLDGPQLETDHRVMLGMKIVF